MTSVRFSKSRVGHVENLYVRVGGVDIDLRITISVVNMEYAGI